jgi:hypothetical protein
LVAWLKSFRWQETQAVLAEVSAPPVWHDEQASAACAPVNGKPVLAWLKVAPSQFVVLWHDAHSVGNPTEAWFGLEVFW